MTNKIRVFQNSQERRFLISKNVASSAFSMYASQFGSDKDGIAGAITPFKWPTHTYGTFYDFLFAHKRNQIKNVFECGIGSRNSEFDSNMGSDGRPGASLRLWREYFPNCEVTAVDIDPSALINENRIKSFQMDQTSEKSVLDFWHRNPEIYFDLMVDDGLHTVNAGMTLLKHSLSRLKPDGYYVIEDVSANDLQAFSSRLSAENYDFYVVSLSRTKEFGFDNNLIVIRARE